MKYLVGMLVIVAAVASWRGFRDEACLRTSSSSTGKPVMAAPTTCTVAPSENVGPMATAMATEAEKALREGPPEKRDRALHELLPRLVASDPAVAARLALSWEAAPLRSEILRQVVQSWVENDARGALKWLTSLPDPDDRNLAEAAAVDYLAQNDPASAVELSLLLGLGTRDGSLERRVQLWAEESPDEAVAWIGSKPAGTERDRLLARIARVRAWQDPVEAGRLVVNQMTPGSAQDAAIVSVVHQWAINDPAGAAEWVAQFQPGPLRTCALVELETARKQSPTRSQTSHGPQS